MATMTVTGLDEFSANLEAIANGSVGAAKKAIYDGADILADAVKSQIQQLPSITDAEAIRRYWKKEPGQITERQKAGLVNSLGIAPMQEKGGVIDTHIGFDGYNEVRTKRWPNGQPNIVVARAVESGSSYMQKTPFIQNAVRSKKSIALLKMQDTFKKEIDKLGG